MQDILIQRQETRRTKKGFSIIEIMAVIGIIGLLAIVVLSRLGGTDERSKRIAAQQVLKGLSSSIQQFEDDMDRLPSSLDELKKEPSDSDGRWQAGGYVAKKIDFKDPWKQRYVYNVTEGDENPYELYSKGPKGGKKISVWDL